MHVRSCSIKDNKTIYSPENVTWEYIEKYASEELNSSDVYGFSKVLVTCYTVLLSREQPHLMVSCVTPGWGVIKTPRQETLPILHCLFELL